MANTENTPAFVSRRRLLTAATVVGAAAIGAAPAAIADSADAELLALEAEINRLYTAANRIMEERIAPLDAEYLKVWQPGPGLSKSERWERAKQFGNQSGREAAIVEQNAILEEADALIERIWSTPATSAAGRAAKVRVLFNHIMSADWDGEDLDWDIHLARRLFFDLAGMSEADLGGVS